MRQQQEVGPAKRIRNQVAVRTESKTSRLTSFCPSQEASWLLPAQVETYLLLWPASTWWLTTPGNAEPGLLEDTAWVYSTDPDKDNRGRRYPK